MLRSLKSLERYTVSAIDGDIGSVSDFFLDDQKWAIRYLIVETGNRLDERRVLISPISFRQPDWATRRFRVSLTVDKVKGSPRVDVDQPVSRQHERDYYRHFGYPCYWGSGQLWGAAAYPGLLAISPGNAPAPPDDPVGDVHLRSVNELRGYHIHGSDDSIGHVEDFIVDDDTYELRYIVVNTSNVWFGQKVLIAPHWASHVSWEERKIDVGMSRAEIKNGPRWDPAAAVDRAYESRLYDHYGRPGYWATAGNVPNVAERPHRFAHEAEGGASGALAGALLGAVAGPPGIAVGALIGGVAGTLVGAALDTTSTAQAARTRVLDAEIGVSDGTLGAPNLAHPPAKTGAYSGASAGVDSSSGEPSAEGPMPRGEG